MNRTKIMQNTLDFVEYLKYDISKNNEKNLHHIPKNNKMTGSAIKLLHLLTEQDGINQRTISQSIRVSPQAVSKVIKQLSNNQYVEIKKSNVKKESLVYITPAGLLESQNLYNLISIHANKLFSNLSDDELSIFDTIITKILTNNFNKE